MSFAAVTSNTISPLTSLAWIVISWVSLLLLVAEIFSTLFSANAPNGFANANKRTPAVATFDIFFI